MPSTAAASSAAGDPLPATSPRMKAKRPVDISHQTERRTQHVADAERDSAGVELRQIAVEQILDDGLFAGGEHRLRNLAAGLEGTSRERDLPARARELEFQLATFRRQHD